MPTRFNQRIIVWFDGILTPARNISINSASEIRSLFAIESGDFFVSTSNSSLGVIKWMLNSTSSISAMYTCQACWDLFVDINNVLYCSMGDFHQVVAKSLNSESNALRIVAGTGSSGSTSAALHDPRGLFVDINLDLYVVDQNNNRIQLFLSGQLIAITVAGNTSPTTTISLNKPAGVTLDADNYLFIIEYGGNRIVGSGPYGFRCLVGCTGSSGSASNQLSGPASLSFDSFGNIFVADITNNRVQKFSLISNSCGKINKHKKILISDKLFKTK